jgi:hypothetical protein
MFVGEFCVNVNWLPCSTDTWWEEWSEIYHHNIIFKEVLHNKPFDQSILAIDIYKYHK